jgi:adenylylsulfate kinase-like enzyme
VRSSRPHVIWICGSPGAGKSATAWFLFEELASAGIQVAYVDIDQLGMLYPALDDDPERHLLKAQALVALIPGYRSAGAQVLIVSGVVDPEVGPDPASMAPVDLTLCMVSPDPDALRDRLLARGWTEEEADEAVAEDAALRRAPFLDAVVETAGLTVAECAVRLREYVKVAGPFSAAIVPAVSSATTRVVVVTGPRAAGSSTVGFGLAMNRWRAGLRAGFLDMQQLAFLAGPTTSHDARSTLAIAQLATMHEYMEARGANLLVVTGHLSIADRTGIRASIPAGRVMIVRIRADASTLKAHVRERVAGSEARLAGDDLAAAGPDHQRAIVAQALLEQKQLDARANDDAVVDVIGRPSGDTIAEVERFAAGAR